MKMQNQYREKIPLLKKLIYIHKVKIHTASELSNRQAVSKTEVSLCTSKGLAQSTKQYYHSLLCMIIIYSSDVTKRQHCNHYMV